VHEAYQMAYRDELTGLPGRRALNDRLERLGRNYVIAMADVDHFKKFNDTYGHETGDHVLCMVASRLRQLTRNGSAYRYGGEEFTLVFPRRSPDEVMAVLENLRDSISRYPLHIRGCKRDSRKKIGLRLRGLMNRGSAKTVHVTVSIGVAGAHQGNTPEAVMQAADKALYKAKAAGRNRVVASTAKS